MQILYYYLQIISKFLTLTLNSTSSQTISTVIYRPQLSTANDTVSNKRSRNSKFQKLYNIGLRLIAATNHKYGRVPLPILAAEEEQILCQRPSRGFSVSLCIRRSSYLFFTILMAILSLIVRFFSSILLNQTCALGSVETTIPGLASGSHAQQTLLSNSSFFLLVFLVPLWFILSP